MPFLFLHEACHYLAARAMGLNAELHWHYVGVRGLRNDAQRIVFKLAPALVGIVGTLIALSALLLVPNYLLGVTLLVGCSLAWQAACFVDFYDVWYFWRHGHWHQRDGQVVSMQEAFQFKWNPRE